MVAGREQWREAEVFRQRLRRFVREHFFESVRELPRRGITQYDAHFEGFDLFRALRPDQQVDYDAIRISLVSDAERFQIKPAPFTFFIDVFAYRDRHIQNIQRTGRSREGSAIHESFNSKARMFRSYYNGKHVVYRITSRARRMRFLLAKYQ